LVIVFWTLRFKASSSTGNFLLGVLLLLFLTGLLFPAVAQVRDAARRTVCTNNMRQLQLAIWNYESAHGHFPGDTTTVNKNGKVIRTSWRVHMLPYMDMDSLRASYRFDEPWDSPSNAALQKEISSYLFGCPAHDTDSKTPYKLVVGAGTAFEDDRKVLVSDCVDGIENTIGIVEDIQNPVDFFKPEDMSVDDAIKLFNNSSKKNCAHVRDEFFTREYVGFHFTKLDGSVHRWPVNPKNKIDERAFLIADGKPIDLDVDASQLREIKWGRVLSLIAYILLWFWPLAWAGDQASQEQESESEAKGTECT